MRRRRRTTASILARAIFASMWIGWQREIGWSNPGLGLLLIAVAPAATVLSVALVFWVGASNGGTDTVALGQGLAYVIVGASLYAQVGQYAWVPNSAISEGKNNGLFTQVYMTPSSSVPYLVGRCLASFADSLPVVTLSFLLAYYASMSLLGGQQLPLILSPVSILMVVLAMVASFPAAVGLGLILGAYSLFASRLEWALPSYIAGGLMIFSEALFPLSVLPWPLSAIGQFVPFTYLMRASRAALLDPGATGYLFNLGGCALTSALALFLGLAAYRWGETRARMKGFLDRKTR